MLVRSAVSVASDAAVALANRANPNLVPVTPGSGGAAASPAAGFGGGVPFDSLCRFEDLSCLPRR